MVRKYISVICIGFVFWIVSNAYVYPIINVLVFEKKYPVLLYDIYSLCLYVAIGAFLGWFGETKGWLLGLIWGVVMIVFFLIVSFISDFVEMEITNVGYVKSMSKLVFYHALFVFYLVMGGIIGNQIKKRLK